MLLLHAQMIMLILIKLRWLLYFLYREIKYSCGRCKKLNCICICRHWHTRKSYLVYSLHESFRVPYNILSKLDFKTVKYNFSSYSRVYKKWCFCVFVWVVLIHNIIDLRKFNSLISFRLVVSQCRVPFTMWLITHWIL